MGNRAAEEAWECITRLFISDENEVAVHRAAGAAGLTVRNLHALLDLRPDEPRSMGWLAEQWFCHASNVTTIVDELEDRGYVRRETSPTDRRVKFVRLTPEGIDRREEAKALLLAAYPKGLMSLTAAELRTLRDLLRKAAEGYGLP